MYIEKENKIYKRYYTINIYKFFIIYFIVLLLAIYSVKLVHHENYFG